MLGFKDAGVSHVYTMVTGNTIVKSLLWHEGTSSLLASIRSNHGVSYMHRDEMTMIVGNGGDEDDWPTRTEHEKTYFGTKWH